MLKNINFGNLDAQFDTILRDKSALAFYESKSWEEVLRSQKLVYIGRKGSGKTALRIGLEVHGHVTNRITVPITFKDFSTTSFGDTLDKLKKIDGFSLPHFLRSTWRYAIGTAAMNACLSPNHVGRLTGYRFQACADLVNDPGHLPCVLDEARNFSLYDTFMNAAKAIKEVLLDAGRPESAKLQYPAIGRYRVAEQELMQLLDGDHSLLVTFDELDKSYARFDDVLCPLIVSLVDTIREIAADYTDNRNLAIKCFIPQDSVNPANYRDLDKIRDLVQFIEWSESDLRMFLAKRIRPAIGNRSGAPTRVDSEKTANQVLAFILPTSFSDPWGNQRDPFSWVVHFTQKRPRDLLFLFKEMQARATGERFVDSDLYSLLPQTAKKLADDIVAEYAARFPQIGSVMAAFDGKPAEMPRAEVEKIIAGVPNIAQSESSLRYWTVSLYQVGFLGRVLETTATGNYRTRRALFSFDQAYSTEDIQFDRLVVHRMFWERYNMSPTEWSFQFP